MRAHVRASIRLAGVSAGIAGVLVGPAVATAGGLTVPGVGPQAAGRAGAFVARADDASALAYNPAGLAKQSGTVILVGANFIDYDITFERDGAYEGDPSEVPWAGQAYQAVSDESKPAIGVGGFQAVPMLAVSTDLGLKVEGLRFGFGLIAPLGYPTRDFTPDYEFEEAGVAPPPQRYDAMSQEAAVVLPSVAVGYALGKKLGIGDKLDIGGRFSWGFGDIKATSYVWGVRNYDEEVASDGFFSVDVSDKFIPVFALGALYRPADSIEIGVNWTSQINIEAKGTGSAVLGSSLGLGDQHEEIQPENMFPNCEAGGTPGDFDADPPVLAVLKACAAIKLPMTASLGARWVKREGEGATRVDRADFELDVVWEGWKAASDYEIIVDGTAMVTGRPINKTVIAHGFQDTFSIRAGGSYLLDVGGGGLALRAGAAYDTAAAKQEWQRVDIDGAARTTLMAGASWRMSRFQIDVAGGVVLEGSRHVGSDCNPTATAEGCTAAGDTPQADRTQPDPLQPLNGPLNQVESPFNSGNYDSGYVTFAFGVSTWF